LRLGVVANVYRPGIEAALSTISAWAEAGGHKVNYEDSLAGHAPKRSALVRADEAARDAEIVLALGGDGTMLRAARLVGAAEIPLLGVNLGGLGFLTQVTPADLGGVLQRLSKQNYHTESRMVLAAKVPEWDRPRFAVNEVTFDRGPQARAIELRLDADAILVSRYVADGLILATPTGSTAYALSAGGPVTVPGLKAIVVVPVAAHSLSQRALVFPDDVCLTVTCEEPNAEAAVTLDGQDCIHLAFGQTCEVRKADFALRLVRFPEEDFFTLVRTKLGWGVDPRHAHRDSSGL
jgi:NAD+ kinase